MHDIADRSVGSHPGQLTDRLNDLLRVAPRRVAMPIAVYPGAALTGATVRDLVTNADAQVDAVSALHERYDMPIVLSAMDLSVEAETFGATVRFSDHELPAVTEGRITAEPDLKALTVPCPGDGRSGMFIEVVRRLARRSGNPVVMGGCIGPFSLSARLLGLSEALGLTITDPGFVHALLEKVTSFLSAYVGAFREAGADGVIMAEPSAGLLSPNAVAAFSSPYVRRVVESTNDRPFAFVLHNCAARTVHLDAVLQAGSRWFHFGAPMDLPMALGRVASDIALCGNLDPATVFCQGTPESVRERTHDLLHATRAHANFVISSGCDIPLSAPVGNLDAFFEAVNVVPGDMLPV